MIELHSLTKRDDGLYTCRCCTGGPWPSTTQAGWTSCPGRLLQDVQPVNTKPEETTDG